MQWSFRPAKEKRLLFSGTTKQAAMSLAFTNTVGTRRYKKHSTTFQRCVPIQVHPSHPISPSDIASRIYRYESGTALSSLHIEPSKIRISRLSHTNSRDAGVLFFPTTGKMRWTIFPMNTCQFAFLSRKLQECPFRTLLSNPSPKSSMVKNMSSLWFTPVCYPAGTFY